MKNRIFTCCFLAAFIAGYIAQAQSKIPSSDIQIKSALLAAPLDMQEAATVYGYNEEGAVVLLREGTNQTVCLADNPKTSGFSASCYHKDLEPFMARGRELKAAGKSFDEIFKIREEEVKSGKLKIPKDATLFVYYAPEGNFDIATGTVTNGNFRYVVYIPFATSESTGLPLSPQVPGMPWIMDPGTHRAHIMITPPPLEENKGATQNK